MTRRHSVQYDVPWLTSLIELHARGGFDPDALAIPPRGEETSLTQVLDAIAVLLPDSDRDGDPLAGHLRRVRLDAVDRLLALRCDRSHPDRWAS